MEIETVSQNRCFGGVQSVYTHPSNTCGVEMTFAVYLPPQAEDGPVPVLWYLSGLTCTHENAMTKGGFQEHASDHGTCPDLSRHFAARRRISPMIRPMTWDRVRGFTSTPPRDPWRTNYRMYDYVVSELRDIVSTQFPISDRHGITGHSMGGHGALTIALRNPDIFDSVSAFAPITNPTRSDWGRKQLSAYLGDDEAAWSCYDSSILLEEHGWKDDILIDQGSQDQFLDLLKPESLASVMAKKRQPGLVRMQPGYDHSYYFVTTFARDHVEWHAERLWRQTH